MRGAVVGDGGVVCPKSEFSQPAKRYCNSKLGLGVTDLTAFLDILPSLCPRYRLGCHSVATRLRLESEWLQRLQRLSEGCWEVTGKLRWLQRWQSSHEISNASSPNPSYYKIFSYDGRILTRTTPLPPPCSTVAHYPGKSFRPSMGSPVAC